MTRQTFESSELTIVVEHESAGSFCEPESLDSDVPQLQLLVLDFLENLRDEPAYWCLADEVLHCMEEADAAAREEHTLGCNTNNIALEAKNIMYNSSTTDNKNKINFSFQRPIKPPRTYPTPKLNFQKKTMIPTTFDNSTSTSTIEIPIHQSLQKNSN
jgi:hypothetical protein